MYQTGCNAYRQSASNTVENNQVLLLKLYGGAIRFSGCARQGIMQKSPKIRGENISKAIDIITELDCALDREKGGQVVTQLASLYQWVINQFTTANFHNDLNALDQAESILVTLKEGFEEAHLQLKNGGAAPQTQTQVMEEVAPNQESVRFAI